MYKIIYAETVQKQIKKIDTRYARAIIKSIDRLKSDPFLGKKLHDNLRQYRSIREGVYRIIYQIDGKNLIIYVISVAHR